MCIKTAILRIMEIPSHTAGQQQSVCYEDCFPFCSGWLLEFVQAKESQQSGERFQYVVDKKDVKERVGELLKIQDLSKYVL